MNNCILAMGSGAQTADAAYVIIRLLRENDSEQVVDAVRRGSNSRDKLLPVEEEVRRDGVARRPAIPGTGEGKPRVEDDVGRQPA